MGSEGPGPGTSRIPPAIPLAMSAPDQQPTATGEASRQTSQAPLQSPIPIRPAQEQYQNQTPTDPNKTFASAARLEPCRPLPHDKPHPRLRFQCHDVSHKAADVLFENNNPARLLQGAVDIVLSTLYHSSCDKSAIPPVNSITLIMREMDGVAYTTGNNDLGDNTHKEIHFNLNHITNVGPNKARMVSEIRGVFVHEMVHCWQWTADGMPGGLVEGIADWVRLKAGFSPPHWKREAGDDWDAGYQSTAYFLEWLDEKYGDGKIVELNGRLRGSKYTESLWVDLFGHKVDKLFDDYKAALKAS